MSRGWRRVAVVTGTRAEYGLLKTVMRAIAAQPRLELQIAVTGIHLLPAFGRTIEDIRHDGWVIHAEVPMQRGDDGPLDQAEGLGRGVAGLAQFFENARIDMVLVLGDRIEAMAGALAAVTTGRLLAHIHGGDVALGDFDDSLRHAISKLAHIHLAATRAAARRLVRMGEARQRVHVVGAPGLDRLRELIAEHPPRRGRSRVALVVYHASGRPAEVEERVARVVLDEVRRAGLRRRIILPNTDRGNAGVRRAIKAHAAAYRATQSRSAAAPRASLDNPSEVEVLASLAHDDYLRALLDADVLVGNSSSGIIEAPLAGTPSVNIGDRQASRESGGCSVISCGETAREIRAALRQALALRPRRSGRSVYGDGRAGARIAEILAKLNAVEALRRKKLTY